MFPARPRSNSGTATHRRTPLENGGRRQRVSPPPQLHPRCMLAIYKMHHIGKFTDSALAPHSAFDGHSQGYTHASLISHATGSVHTGLSINELAAGGTIAPHVHSFEEGFYVLSGEAIVTINDQTYRLRPGDYGVSKVGVLHAWRNAGSAPVRWFEMAAPQPKPAGKERDTFFQRGGVAPADAALLDLTDLRGNLLGHFDASQIP